MSERRMVEIPIPAEKAPAIRRLMATIDEVAAVHGQPTADATLQAAEEMIDAGLFERDVSDEEAAAWLVRRVAEILADGKGGTRDDRDSR